MANEVCFRTLHLDQPWKLEQYRNEGGYEVLTRILREKTPPEQIIDESRNEYLRIIEDLQQKGAEAVIEGCTEIGLLVKQEHTRVPLYDTTAIHARQAVAEALG